MERCDICGELFPQEWVGVRGACLGCRISVGEDNESWLMRTIRTLSRRITKLEQKS